MDASWIESEFDDVDFGDTRLNDRCQFIVEAFDKSPGASIPQAFKSWAETKACYEFFKNPSVNEEKILEPHIKKTLGRIKNEEVALLLNDTSSADYTGLDSITGLGRLAANQNGDNLGIFIHPLIAVTPDRLCLGIAHAKIFTRSLEKIKETKATKKKRPIEEKEIYRWIEGYKEASLISHEAPDTQIIYISDREGDFIDLFDYALNSAPGGADFIIRCSQQERLVDEKNDENKKYKKILTCLKDAPKLGEIKFVVTKTDKRNKREVTQSIKSKTVVLKQQHINGRIIKKIKINVVMAIEENPPEGEKALCWMFITTLPIETFEQATRVIEYYLCRWEIETFFKILKSGCKVESRQLEKVERLLPMLALFMIVSWRILYLIMIGRANPNMPCTDIFEDSEWMSVHRILFKNKTIPEKPPSVGEFIEMIASLGGHLGRKSDSPAGPKTMWIGLTRMADFALAWEAFGPSPNTDNKGMALPGRPPTKIKKNMLMMHAEV